MHANIQQRFKALDTDLHARDSQLAAAEAQIRELIKGRDILNSDDKVQKAKIAALEDLLARAHDDVKQLEAKVTKLQKDINEGHKHDIEDHQELESLRDARLKLKRELEQALPALSGAKARVTALTEEVAKLKAERDSALAQLLVQKNLNKTLTDEVDKLKKANKQLTEDLEPLRKKNAALQNEVDQNALDVGTYDKALKDMRVERDNIAHKVLVWEDKTYNAEVMRKAYWRVLNNRGFLDEVEKPVLRKIEEHKTV